MGGRLIRNMRMHTGPVLCTQMDDTKIVSGGTDGKLRLLDLRKKEPEKIDWQHKTSVIRCLHYDDAHILVGTEQGQVRVLDIKTGKFPHPSLSSGFSIILSPRQHTHSITHLYTPLLHAHYTYITHIHIITQHTHNTHYYHNTHTTTTSITHTHREHH